MRRNSWANSYRRRPSMGRTFKLFVSGLLAGIIGAGGALIAAFSELPSGGGPSFLTWIVIGVTGLVAAAKDWKTYLAKLPDK